MEAKQKENAVRDFLAMVSKSWTWQRMTYEEITNFKDLLFSAPTENATKGDYRTRYNVCHAVYNAYLNGLGYSGQDWREPEETDLRTELHTLRSEFIRKQCNPYPFIGHAHY